MLREKLFHHRTEKGFRLRGGEITRIEGLSDAVFAFAVTLLVVSLEVPKTFNELTIIMRGFISFAVCFTLLMLVWHEQYIFFRRYNMQDTGTVVLNAILLFVVLFYVYPLKFLFSLMFNSWMGLGTQVHLPGGGVENAIEAEQVPALMAIYSAGYLAVSCVFMLLLYRALRRRQSLELNAIEVFETRTRMGASMLQAAVALISLLMALLGGQKLGGLSGVIYPVLMAPGFTVYHAVMGRRKSRLETSVTAQSTSAG